MFTQGRYCLCYYGSPSFWRKVSPVCYIETFLHVNKFSTNCLTKDTSTAMSNVKFEFSSILTVSDPVKSPVIIIGQVKNLMKAKFSSVKCKLEPYVSEEVYDSALASLHPSPTDTCSLYLNLATIAALPAKSSRHNAPSRAHAITKIIKSTTVGVTESIVIVCERKHVYPSACAVARAYPVFTRKTSGSSVSSQLATIRVEFVLVSDDSEDEECNTMADLSLSQEDVYLLETVTTAVRISCKIVDTPCNEMNVDNFVEETLSIANSLGVKSIVIRGEELKEKGFGGIYGVGKAASIPPALLILSHEVPGATETIAWVGKGIVYDTGGLSIKGKTAMPGMKRDCGGAAGVLGAFFTAVKTGFTQNLHAVLCLAENAVGPDATRPDDIHKLYSGRTVEINNTDAEGRLVLSDGVVYAQKDLKANIILDMATLTGAQGICTGKFHAAVLTNSELWEDAVVHAGRVSADLVFPVLYCPELHFAEFSSVVADMKNSVADRNNAQTSCAGLFIGAHLGFDFPGIWIHIDMAATAYVGERSTGYGVALLPVLFGKFSEAKMLKMLSEPAVIDRIQNVSKKFRRN